MGLKNIERKKPSDITLGMREGQGVNWYALKLAVATGSIKAKKQDPCQVAFGSQIFQVSQNEACSAAYKE